MASIDECNMGWVGSVVLIAVLAAFNLYCMDVLMRMRADVLVIRKAVAPGKEPFVDDDADGEGGEGGGKGAAAEDDNAGPSPAERKATEWRRKRKGDSAVAAFFKGIGLV